MLCLGALSIFFLLKSVLVTASAISSQPRDATVEGSSWDYDVVVVGGGPAGLSALSGLARIGRKAFLIDSGEYRNNDTRHMHDVIGLDGVKPAYFRWLAREKLAFYNTVGLTNGTVTNITAHNTTTGFPSFTVEATLPYGPARLTARSVILATGIRDIIPDTPGIAESWARGIYWCPWCDGNEHANQSMGLLSDLSGVAQAYFEISTLNSDVMAFVNGTDTPENRKKANETYPGWDQYFQAKNVRIFNQTILNITRLRDGYNPNQDPSIPTAPEYDLFRIYLEGGKSFERAVFFADFDSELRSNLGQQLGVALVGKPAHLFVDAQLGLQTNIPMVYAVGDANNDNSTNIPHAMWSGKRAAVQLQVALADQDMKIELDAIGAEKSTVSTRGKELDPRDVWDMINGPPGDLFYAGEFDL